MNNLPRQALRRILAKYGNEVCGNAKRCENLLNDSCGSYRREINVLVNAIEERVPLDLLAGSRSMPTELLLTRLEKRLEEQTAMTAEAASWAVASWALALNVATDAEIEAREKRAKSSPAASNPPPDAAAAKIPNANRTKPAAAPPPKRQTPVPPPRINPPPVIRQPTKMPSPLPPMSAPKSNPPVVQPSSPPQTVNPPIVFKRGFGLFRGCLFVIFLLIVSSVVLFFGVPYAIETMRQTQQERNNEPPRFPVR